MATFEKKTWADRVSEFPTRRTLTKSDNSTEIVTVSRTEGEITNPGDAFNAQNMNDLENRIDAVVQEMDTNFQAGVDAVYNACVAAGLTPSASTPEAIAAAISTVGGATAVAGDIRSGKKAFSQNQMLTGTFAPQEKTITASRAQQIVAPDSGKFLSKVTVNKYPDANGTYTCPSNWDGSPVAGGNGDMGTGNNLRYVNAQNVLAKGHLDTYPYNFRVQAFMSFGDNFIGYLQLWLYQGNDLLLYLGKYDVFLQPSAAAHIGEVNVNWKAKTRHGNGVSGIVDASLGSW